MKTCPQCRKQVQDVVSRCECGHTFPPSSLFNVEEESRLERAQARARSRGIRIAGGVLILAGLAVAAWFAFGYDSTVEGPKQEIAGYRFAGDRVENIGRNTTRLVGANCGIGLMILGGILMLHRPVE